MAGEQNEQSEQQKTGAVQKLKDRVAELRRKHRSIDHVLRMQQHYSKARGNSLAGAITFFGFLSMFPILALAFVALGYVVRVYPDARTQVEQFLTQNLPGLVGNAPNQLNIDQIAQGGAKKTSAGIIGIVGVLLAGLGWLDAMREALRQMWAVEPGGGNFIKKKLIDIFVLITLGALILVTTALSSVATSLTGQLLEALGLSSGGIAAVLLKVLAIALAILANTLVLAFVFARLPGHKLPLKNVLTGALLGAVGIEILKTVGTFLIARTTNNPVYASFAIVVGLLVWFNFIARVFMYAAAWCVVGPVPTLEAKVAAEGETLDKDEAEAATDARQRKGDDADVPMSEPYKTTAGAVPATTSGTGHPASGGPTGGAGGRSASGNGTKSGKGRGKDKDKDKAKAKAKQNGQGGGLASFAGVLALLAVRRKRKAEREREQAGV